MRTRGERRGDRMKDIVLFDMDGTLTAARKKIERDTTRAIKELTTHSKVGIVTGSGLNYLIEQCSMLWEEFGACNPENIILMPCNGTQYYEWKDNAWTCLASENMRDYVGAINYDHMIRVILNLQSAHVNEFPGAYPLTGNFLSYRKSMINWSPVGRDANDSQRNEFLKFDHGGIQRTKLIEALTTKLQDTDFPPIEMRLGGETSIDIYPVGWDKSFALDYFTDMTCWFVGDRCNGLGNDKEIYDQLVVNGRAYQTTGPSETIKIVQEIIIPAIMRMK